MRVAVVGATGVFGSRLADLLARDGHAVIAVGRRGPVRADRNGDLSALWAALPEAVVDAAGPFHAGGTAPYRLAQACIAHGVHYLDLADDAAFCAGTAVLDTAAKAAGVVVLSGVSSVPALSSAAVASLAAGMTEIDVIDMAILPGNRAPRGRAVVQGILARAGLQFRGWVDGHAVSQRNWSDPEGYGLAPGMLRVGYQIEVPDQRLFPAAFGARTVIFRAGLELAVMGRGLAALSRLRGALGFGMPAWLVAAIHRGAALLAPFGTDAGGMAVSVTGRAAGGWVRRDWRLVVPQGEGPYVPGVAARAALRDIAAITPGARPAVAVLSLDACEAAMAGLAVAIERAETPVVPLFAGVAGFAALPPEVRATHDHAGPRRMTGLATVERGRGIAARAIAALFRFPAAGDAVPVTVMKWPGAGREVWERSFAARRFRSELRTTPQGMTERFGPFTFRLGLHVAGGALHFPVAGGRAAGLPLPRWLLPQSEAREYAEDGRMRFDVALFAPFGLGLMVRYRGWLAGGEKDGPDGPG